MVEVVEDGQYIQSNDGSRESEDAHGRILNADIYQKWPIKQSLDHKTITNWNTSNASQRVMFHVPRSNKENGYYSSGFQFLIRPNTKLLNGAMTTHHHLCCQVR